MFKQSKYIFIENSKVLGVLSYVKELNRFTQLDIQF